MVGGQGAGHNEPADKVTSIGAVRRLNASDLDFRTKLHDAIGRQVEEIGSRRGVAVHAGEHLLAPLCHASAQRRHDGGARQEIRGRHRIELDALPVKELQRGRDVDIVLEAEFQRHRPAALAQRLRVRALSERHPRHL